MEKFPKTPEVSEAPRVKINIGELRNILDLNLRGLEEKGYENTKEYMETKELLEDLKPITSGSFADDKVKTRFRLIIDNNRALSEGKEKGVMSAFGGKRKK